MFLKNSIFILLFVIVNFSIFAGGGSETQPPTIANIQIDLPAQNQTSIPSVLISLLVTIFQFYGRFDAILTGLMVTLILFSLLFMGWGLFLGVSTPETVKRKAISLFVVVISFRLFYFLYFSLFNLALELHSIPFRSIETNVRRDITAKYSDITRQLQDIRNRLGNLLMSNRSLNDLTPQDTSFLATIDPNFIHSTANYTGLEVINLRQILTSYLNFYTNEYNRVSRYVRGFSLFLGNDLTIHTAGRSSFRIKFSRILDINSFFLITSMALETEIPFKLSRPISSLIYIIAGLLYQVLTVIFYIMYYILLFEFVLIGLLGTFTIIFYMFDKFRNLLDRYINTVFTTSIKIIMYSFVYSIFYALLLSTRSVFEDNTSSSLIIPLTLIFYCLFSIIIILKGPEMFSQIISGSFSMGGAISSAGSTIAQTGKLAGGVVGMASKGLDSLAGGAYKTAQNVSGFAGALRGAHEFASNSQGAVSSLGAMSKVAGNSLANSIKSAVRQKQLQWMGVPKNSPIQDQNDLAFAGGNTPQDLGGDGGGGDGGGGDGGGGTGGGGTGGGGGRRRSFSGRLISPGAEGKARFSHSVPFNDGGNESQGASKNIPQAANYSSLNSGNVLNPYSYRGLKLKTGTLANYYSARQEATKAYFKNLYNKDNNKDKDNNNTK